MLDGSSTCWKCGTGAVIGAVIRLFNPSPVPVMYDGTQAEVFCEAVGYCERHPVENKTIEQQVSDALLSGAAFGL